MQFVILSPFLYVHTLFWGCFRLKYLTWQSFCSFLPLCNSGALRLRYHFKSWFEISWPEMMPQNIPYQTLFLPHWLLQSRDQADDTELPLGVIAKQVATDKYCRRQQFPSSGLLVTSYMSDKPFDFTTKSRATALVFFLDSMSLMVHFTQSPVFCTICCTVYDIICNT